MTATPAAITTATAAATATLHRTPLALVTRVDLSHLARPLAVRSRITQATTEIAAAFFADPRLRRVAVVAWADAPLATRARSVVLAAVEALHSRTERTRGVPAGLLVVFADRPVASERVAARLCAEVGGVPDGVTAVDAEDVCARGVRGAAAAARI